MRPAARRELRVKAGITSIATGMFRHGSITWAFILQAYGAMDRTNLRSNRVMACAAGGRVTAHTDRSLSTPRRGDVVSPLGSQPGSRPRRRAPRHGRALPPCPRRMHARSPRRRARAGGRHPPREYARPTPRYARGTPLIAQGCTPDTMGHDIRQREREQPAAAVLVAHPCRQGRMQAGERIGDRIGAEHGASAGIPQHLRQAAGDGAVVSEGDPVGAGSLAAVAGDADPGEPGILIQDCLRVDAELAQRARPRGFHHDVRAGAAACAAAARPAGCQDPARRSPCRR